jgi:hypothetical protein
MLAVGHLFRRCQRRLDARSGRHRPSPDNVRHYVAIHATMVGLRGTLFQFLGVGLLQLTGSFAAPLLIGSAGFAWAAWQMWSLRGDFARRTGGHGSGH